MSASQEARRLRRLMVAATAGAIAVSTLLVPSPAQALPPGWLDTSYGTGGGSGFGGLDSPGIAGMVDSAGRTVMLYGESQGMPSVSRLTVGGAADAGFATTSLPAGPTYSDLFVGTDGIYVAGLPQSGNGVVLVRLAPAGGIDAAYGVGGLATVGIPNTIDAVSGLAQLTSGDIVVGGTHQRSLPHVDYLAAVTTSGGLDPTWNATGPTPGARSSGDRIVGVAHDGNAAVVAGYDGSGITHVRRFAANGTPDGTFGSAGVMSLPGSFAGQSVDVGTDGDYYLAGVSGPSEAGPVAVARVLPGGTVDSSFGTAGIAVLSISAGRPDGLFTVATASFVYVFSGSGAAAGPFVARLTTTGDEDLAFGTGGYVQVSDGGPWTNARVSGPLGGGVQPSGKPLVFVQLVDDDAFHRPVVIRLNTANSDPPGSYVALTASRILDTRTGNGAAKHVVAAGGSLSLQVGGRGGVPLGGAEAVVLNVTVVSPTGSGFVTVYPSGSARPTASNINHGAGDVTPNLVTVPLGSDGKVLLYNGSAGTVHLLADVIGYYLGGVPSVPGAFTSLAPARILDTRSGVGATQQPVPPGGTLLLTVAGAGGVPVSGASSVVINATVTNQTGPGYLTVYASGTTRPASSNINFYAGRTRANLTTVRLGSDGKLSIFNGSTAPVDVLADVAGYYIAGTPTQPGTYVSVNPTRVLDTRRGTHPIPAGATLHVSLSGVQTLPEPTSGLVFNATVTQTRRSGFATYAGGTSWPDGAPTTSTVNFVAGQTVSNMAITSGKPFLVYNGSSGSIQALMDLAGYFRD